MSDEGPGLPEHERERVFERFYQVDVSDRREKGGTGPGLAICKSIVEEHGGRIWAESRPGAGATFRLTMPARTRSAAPSELLRSLPEA